MTARWTERCAAGLEPLPQPLRIQLACCLLATGEVSREWVAELLKSARGHEYQSSPHHQAPSVTVHVVKTRTWYIKFYFYPHTLFISVHQ